MKDNSIKSKNNHANFLKSSKKVSSSEVSCHISNERKIQSCSPLMIIFGLDVCVALCQATNSVLGRAYNLRSNQTGCDMNPNFMLTESQSSAFRR